MEHSTDELAASFFRTKAAAYASPMTVKAWIDSNQDFVLVDVRLPGAARTWQIPGSLGIPSTQMGESFNELPKDKIIVLYCWDPGAALPRRLRSFLWIMVIASKNCSVVSLHGKFYTTSVQIRLFALGAEAPVD